MIKKIFFILFITLSFFSISSGVFAQEKIFTSEELSQYDGKDGRDAYYAYEGKVYDVTTSKLWKLGEHFGVYAGEDLTGKMEDAPHGMEVFAGFPVVGTYEVDSTQVMPVATGSTTDESVVIEKKTVPKKWYEGRIRIFGISILGWTGIIMGIFFVLTFATCFAMPWAKLPLPWKGSKIGPDALDNAPRHMIWSSIHKHFVWWVVILGVIHGVLGVLQMFGWYL